MRIKHKFNPDKLFFTSDSHFFHENIIKFCHRPFNDADHMNKTLISNWNEIVDVDDDVIIAGDFIHSGQIDNVKRILNSLNGRKWLTYGNHCYQNRLDRDIFNDLFEIKTDVLNILVGEEGDKNPTQFFISHYPHVAWPRGSYHLYGHVHSGPNSTSNEHVTPHPLRYDIGVDNNNYYPISYRELMKIFDSQKTFNIKNGE